MKPVLGMNHPAEKWFLEAVDYLVDQPLEGRLRNSLFPLLDSYLRETPEEYTLEIAVPGMRKKDLQLEVKNQVLTVQG